MSRKELATSVAEALGLLVGIALLCYGNILYALLLSPYVFVFVKKKRDKLRENRLWKLNLQFADAIRCLSVAMESGYSVENAFTEAYRDLSLTYKEDEPIMCEIKGIILKIRNNMPIEKALYDFGLRSGLEDVMGFADVFVTSKRTGGNIISIIKSTTEVTRTRVELKRELKTVIASAKYEADIMKAVPFAIILYLRLFSPDLISNLYGNSFGVIFMTIILGVYVILCELSNRIVRIDL